MWVLSEEREWRPDLALAGLAGFALVGVLTLVFAWPLAPAARSSEQPVIGELRAATSQVRRRLGDNLVWSAIRVGSPVHQQDSIYVAEDASAVVALADGSVIDIDENSLVVLHEFVGRPTDASIRDEVGVAVEIRRGGVTGRASSRPLALSRGSTRVQVSSGGRVAVRQSGDGVTATVSQGRAKISTGRHGEILVAGGERRVVSDAGKALRAEQLTLELLAPAADARRPSEDGPTTMSFRWRGRRNAGATRYRFELSANSLFDAPLRTVETTATSLSVSELSPGVYYWRVRAGDEASEERKLVLLGSAVPTPYLPRPGEVIILSRQTNVRLAWTEVPGASGYRVEFARAGSSSDPLLSVNVTHPTFSLPLHTLDLDEASYCYRVRAVLEFMELLEGAPWSKPICVELLKEPRLPAPLLYEPKHVPAEPTPGQERGSLLWLLFGSVAHAAQGDSDVVLRWQAIPSAKAYRIEIARDREFREVIVDTEVPRNSFRWQPTGPLTYYWRVRAVGDGGREGTVSTVKTFSGIGRGPKLLAPEAGARLPHGSATPWVTLRWQGTAWQNYRVELATHASFEAPIERTVVKGRAELRIVAPGTGTFYWRVLPVGGDGTVGESTETRKLVFYAATPLPQSPRKGAELELGDGPLEVQFEWSQPPVESFELQVGRDRSFSADTERGRPQQSPTILSLSEPGTYYWRVRGEGPRTAWSETRVFELSPKKEAAEPVNRPARRPRRRSAAGASTFSVAARVGYFSNYGAVSTVRGGAEAALGLHHFADPAAELHAVAVVSYYRASAIGTAGAGVGGVGGVVGGAGTQEATMNAVPVEILARLTFPVTDVELSAAAGLVVGFMHVALSSPTSGKASDLYVELGMLAGVGFAVQVGPGAVFAETSFGISTSSAQPIESNPGGFQFSVGYRLGLW